ncbi:unnamed protein product [Bursaphelenchus xylophilus]|uniref:(pine wood nematode) hypothetical protein n=1 Tax=Bursaphelenchus xylophilus TaxID=6326 RepID=A0A1I7RS08_BURXY|nr:unnamed protein product [Bursaphelenchus xylophilus]CAG9123339.1 unnamed protein product [Bursaphelenchus xylophilus]
MDNSTIEITLKVEPLYRRRSPHLDLNVWKQVEPRDLQGIKGSKTPGKSSVSQNPAFEKPISPSESQKIFESEKKTKSPRDKQNQAQKEASTEEKTKKSRPTRRRKSKKSKSEKNMDSSHISYKADAAKPCFLISSASDDSKNSTSEKVKRPDITVDNHPDGVVTPPANVSRDETVVSFAEVDSRPSSLVKRRSKKTQATDPLLHGSNQMMIDEFTRQAMLQQMRDYSRGNYELVSWLLLFLAAVFLLLYRTERIAETCQNANLAN